MNNIILITNTIYCIFSSFLAFDFMGKIGKRSYRGSYKYFFILLTLMMVLANSLHNTFFNYLSSILFFLILSKFLFFSDKINIYLYTFIFMGTVISVEVIMYIISTVIFPVVSSENYSQYIFASLGSLMIDLLTYRFFVKTISKRLKSGYENLRIELPIMIISFLIIIQQCKMVEYSIPINTKIISFILCIVIVVYNLFFIFISENRVIKNQSKNQAEVEEVKKECDINIYTEESKMYLQQRKLIHDIKDHIVVLENLFISGDFEKANKYSKEILYRLDTQIQFINDPVIQVLINKIAFQCKEKGIDFVYKLEDNIEFNKISDFDKVTIFSNILNNAYEATIDSNGKSKNIILQIKRVKNSVVIYLENAFDNKIIKDEDKFKSTKMNHKGLGINNVYNVVKKLGGIASFDDAGNSFEVIIYIPDDTEVKCDDKNN